MMRPGPRNLITDVPGVLVGNASDARLKSGVDGADRATRRSSPGWTSAAGRRGRGRPTCWRRGGWCRRWTRWCCRAGRPSGSTRRPGWWTGCGRWGAGSGPGPAVVPIVPAAILFDLANGGEKGWDGEPLSGAGGGGVRRGGARTSPSGRRGPGTGAMTATLMGGLGSASIVTEEGATVGALVAVNAFGSVCVPGGREFWAGALEIGDEFGGLGPSGARVAPFTPRRDEAGAGRPGEHDDRHRRDGRGARQGRGAAAGGGGARRAGAGDPSGAHALRRRSRVRGVDRAARGRRRGPRWRRWCSGTRRRTAWRGRSRGGSGRRGRRRGTCCRAGARAGRLFGGGFRFSSCLRSHRRCGQA